MEVGGRVQVSLGKKLLFWGSIIPCVCCVYTLLKVVSHYDLSVVFQKMICTKLSLLTAIGDFESNVSKTKMIDFTTMHRQFFTSRTRARHAG